MELLGSVWQTQCAASFLSPEKVPGGGAGWSGRWPVSVPTHLWVWNPVQTCPLESRILTRSQCDMECFLLVTPPSLSQLSQNEGDTEFPEMSDFSLFHLKELVTNFFGRKECWCCEFESLLHHFSMALSINILMCKMHNEPPSKADKNRNKMTYKVQSTLSGLLAVLTTG